MDSITDLVNNKADEIFPTATQTTTTSPPPQADNQMDLEDYKEIDVIEVSKIEPEPEPEPENPGNTQIAPEKDKKPTIIPDKDASLDLEKLKSKIYSIRDQLDSVIRLIEDDGTLVRKTTTKEKGSIEPEEIDGEEIVQGIFDGEKMVGDNKKEYAVPPNYASKSKIVEGDVMKLTITVNGRFIYKQIDPLERLRKVGILARDPANDQWCIQDENKKYKVLTASVTFFKGKPGDEVVFFIAKDKPNSWAAVDNIVKKKYN